jgi:hypothetical protein
MSFNVKQLAHEVTQKVISRHFLYCYKAGHNKGCRLNNVTGRNDHKCVECKGIYGLRRRFKDAPYKLVEAIEKRLSEQLEEELHPENGSFVCKPTAFVKGGEVYTQLEKLGEDAIHNWMVHEIDVVESRARRRRYIGEYDFFKPRAVQEKEK